MQIRTCFSIGKRERGSGGRMLSYYSCVHRVRAVKKHTSVPPGGVFNIVRRMYDVFGVSTRRCEEIKFRKPDASHIIYTARVHGGATARDRERHAERIL